ncbi:hypothetical protein PHET_12296 [Paragonimus heterotremus]|uniref:Uncharacterized protein n=1 Tax=Paragonimus heterotremus TaxID=100268 RepID=A0A8J4SKM6_9TREM|nr:hypothetical protein PHET_12296 [Paragonimus heterotremus]
MLFGLLGRSVSARTTINFVCTNVLRDNPEGLCQQDFTVAVLARETEMSVDDHRALAIVEYSTSLIDRYCEKALPWRRGVLPPLYNRSVAQKRLNMLRQLALKCGELTQQSSHVMDGHINRGHAEIASEVSFRWNPQMLSSNSQPFSFGSYNQNRRCGTFGREL